ncbi:hypothetical protein [Colwellia sp. E2M01]|uniref:hypothetical protein n=1 Tax=Colwellia sp. E2M01 TaxID=2841561 RepID=UPI001C09B7E0|nr:hypothetical protein [Colwellia sp. E2M01]MBU2870358.1 hypothetical protein [Colwellia sp. E2M01]
MNTLDLSLPSSDLTLVLDSIRHYIKFIDNINESEIDEDTLADLLNDCESLKGVESNLSLLFAEKFGKY